MADRTTDAGNPPWDREPGRSARVRQARACLIMLALTMVVLGLLYVVGGRTITSRPNQ